MSETNSGRSDLIRTELRLPLRYREHDRNLYTYNRRTRRSQTMRNPIDLLNKFIGAIITYGPKNKTKKARMARKAARRKRFAAMKRN